MYKEQLKNCTPRVSPSVYKCIEFACGYAVQKVMWWHAMATLMDYSQLPRSWIGFAKKSACKILHRTFRWSLPYGQRIRPLEVRCRRSVKSSWSRHLRHTVVFCPAISIQGTRPVFWVVAPPKRMAWEQMVLTILHRYVMNLFKRLGWRHTTCARKHESQGSQLSTCDTGSLPQSHICWNVCFAGPLCPRLPYSFGCMFSFLIPSGKLT